MKVRSIDELEDVVAKEYAWRRKELTNLRNTTLSAKHQIKTVLMRSSVPVFYAHWEGFVKKSALAYCAYLNHRRLRYNEMRSNFHAFAVLNHFQGQFPYTKFESYLAIFDREKIKLDQVFYVDAERYIDTKSNLNGEVLRDITMKLGLDYSAFELKENFIDEVFLELRNAIAHGEYRTVEEESFSTLYDGLTELMSTFRNQLLNTAAQQKYLLGL